jgi:thiamine-phosphate pyrophosphorylase
MHDCLYGLYAITPDNRHGIDRLRRDVEAALVGGARVIQYRDKSADSARRREEALALREICAARHVPLIVNDDIELAVAIDADGVHIGREDGELASVRRRLGNQRLIGLSCYNDYDLARQAAAGGADYIAFGSFFASPTKPHAVAATPALLRRARSELGVPVVAIGGISPENGAALVRDGADMLAVISAVFGADDITAAARAFAPCFDNAEEISRDEHRPRTF